MVRSIAGRPDPTILSQRLWGLDFANPVGLAAGFDKDARVPDAVINDWRCGFVEVGTVTPRPQYGNPKPRVFRLRRDGAIINRMGFNSRGLAYVLDRLRIRTGRPGIVGLNLGKNRETEDAAADYEEGIRATANLVSYLVINVSSPNTPGLRDLQRRATLEGLLSRLISVRDAANPRTPLLVKIAPDLSPAECEDVASVALSCGINGIVVSNTTTDRPHVTSRTSQQEGGLSGVPLFHKSTQVLARIFALTGGRIPLIGVGGIGSAADAFEKICAGASLVQIYTALAFRGPMLVSEIKWGLVELLTANGFSSVQQAVGARSAAWISAGERPYSGFLTDQVSGKLHVTSSTNRCRLASEVSSVSGI
jgi:dihydroorotate dehydrogenase